MLVAAADNVEEQFGPGLGEGDVAEFVQDEQVEPLQVLHEPFELAGLPGFQKLVDRPSSGALSSVARNASFALRRSILINARSTPYPFRRIDSP